MDDILEDIVRLVPPPRVPVENEPFRALIFDSYFDTYRGVVVVFRVSTEKSTSGIRSN